MSDASDDSFFTDSEGETLSKPRKQEQAQAATEQQLITMVPVQLYKYSSETGAYDPPVVAGAAVLQVGSDVLLTI
jgi:hypothetical protein